MVLLRLLDITFADFLSHEGARRLLEADCDEEAEGQDGGEDGLGGLGGDPEVAGHE